MDAHDEAAKALREQHQRDGKSVLFDVAMRGGDTDVALADLDAKLDQRIANALRKAAADGAKAERDLICNWMMDTIISERDEL